MYRVIMCKKNILLISLCFHGFSVIVRFWKSRLQGVISVMNGKLIAWQHIFAYHSIQ